MYWMTYVLAALPYMGTGLGALLLPVVRCMALALAQMAHMGLGLSPSDDPVNVCAACSTYHKGVGTSAIPCM